MRSNHCHFQFIVSRGVKGDSRNWDIASYVKADILIDFCNVLCHLFDFGCGDHVRDEYCARFELYPPIIGILKVTQNRSIRDAGVLHVKSFNVSLYAY